MLAMNFRGHFSQTQISARIDSRNENIAICIDIRREFNMVTCVDQL